jgi:hypothetical protein
MNFYQQATATAKKRGEKLLDMIRLDTVSFTLFDLAPVPYEVYMKSYGCSNTLQVIITSYIPMHLILGGICYFSFSVVAPQIKEVYTLFSLTILNVTINIFDPVTVQQDIQNSS